MKVEGPGKTGKTGKAQKSQKSRKADAAAFAKLLDEAMGASSSEGAQETSGVSPAQQIDALLAAQQAEDSTAGGGNRRARKRADYLLDALERIQAGILTGTLSTTALDNLARVVSSHRDTVTDPKLAELLDGIELRARVELAKYSSDRA